MNRNDCLMPTHFTTQPLTETDYDRWTAFVSAAPSGSVYALPAYLDALCSAAGGNFAIVGVFHGDELVGGAPLYLRQSRLGVLATRRYFLQYYGPVIRDYMTHEPAARITRQLAIIARLEEYLRTFNCIHMVLCVRHTLPDVRPFLAYGWRVAPEYTFLVDITDLTAAWHRMTQNQRRLVRRAIDQGLICTEDDDSESLYRQHYQIHQRKQAHLYMPEAAFHTFVARLRSQGLGRIYHARLPDGRSVASQLVLTGPHRVSHTACAGSDAVFLNTGASPFLRWRVFESLAALGYTGNDLTGALYPHDVTRFKSQLGGELIANWVLTRPETLRFRLRRSAEPALAFIRSWLR